MILSCICSHSCQDKLHGPGKRVHNPTKDGSGVVRWRCTVCLKERTGTTK